MKRWMHGVLALALIAGISACGGQDKAAAPAGEDDDRAGGIDTGSIKKAMEKAAPAEAAPAAPEEGSGSSLPVEETAPPVDGAVTDTAPVEDSASAGGGDAHAKLVGTKWQAGEFELNFTDKEKVMIKGGPLAAIAPDGLEATYTFDGTVLQVTAMGQTKTGTWDGTKLVLDGAEATMQ